MVFISVVPSGLFLKVLTGTLMIQPVESGTLLMHITQNSMPSAPASAHRRKNSCSHLTYLTFNFVLGLIGFQSRFPYGLDTYEQWHNFIQWLGTHTTKYESGCLLNSFELIKGPSDFGRGLGGGDHDACDAAFGLNAFSVGPVKEYFEGRS
jgi:hypothetical protein